MQGRGLKPDGNGIRETIKPRVAPRAGAWIETYPQLDADIGWMLCVAPRAGAWIETHRGILYSPEMYPTSPLVQGRGLKPDLITRDVRQYL